VRLPVTEARSYFGDAAECSVEWEPALIQINIVRYRTFILFGQNRAFARS